MPRLNECENSGSTEARASSCILPVAPRSKGKRRGSLIPSCAGLRARSSLLAPKPLEKHVLESRIDIITIGHGPSRDVFGHLKVTPHAERFEKQVEADPGMGGSAGKELRQRCIADCQRIERMESIFIQEPLPKRKPQSAHLAQPLGCRIAGPNVSRSLRVMVSLVATSNGIKVIGTPEDRTAWAASGSCETLKSPK